MVIVFLSGSSQLGGAELCLLDMLSVLRDMHSEWRVSVIAPEEGPVAERAATLGGEVAVLPFPRSLNLLGDSGTRSNGGSLCKLIAGSIAGSSSCLTLAGHLRKLRPNIVHSNSLKMHVLGALAKPHDAKLIWHMHDYVSSRPVMRRVLPVMSSRADSVIAVSESVASDVKDVIGDRPITTIHNSVDLDQFSPYGKAADLDRLCGLPACEPQTVRVGLIATMAWWKGHRIFLEAISKINPQLPLRAYVVGGEIYRTASRQESLVGLRNYAEVLGISKRVGFTGFLAEPAEAIRGLDVVVHCSTQPEPFGRVIIEAMACGTPVISSGLGGAAGILSADYASLYDGTSSGLASAITSLISDPAERSRLGRNGLIAARTRFSQRRMAVQLESAYQKVAASFPGTELATATP